MDEDQDFTSAVDAPRSQLTLLDIMVGVTIAAVTCGFWLQNSQPQNQMIQVVLMVPMLVIFVLGGTVLFSFGRRYFLKQPIDFQPGHWLLCLMGVAFVNQSIAQLVRVLVISPNEMISTDNQNAIMLFFLGQHVVFLVSFLIAGIVMPVRAAWRLILVPTALQNMLAICLFVGVLLGHQWFSLSGIYPYANVAIHLMGIIILPILVTWDYATTNGQRDWLHWLGVAAMLIWNVPTLVLQMMAWF